MHIFVKLRLRDKRVTTIMEDWRVEIEEVENVIITCFEDLGILSIEPILEEYCFDTMITWLKTSPGIFRLKQKAREENYWLRQ